MNSLNYGSREACERLFSSGIVLETEFYWCDNLGWVTLRPKEDVPIESCDWKIYPALSLADAWRELPDEINDKEITHSLDVWKSGELTYCAYTDYQNNTMPEDGINNINPADALIYLLIWVMTVLPSLFVAK